MTNAPALEIPAPVAEALAAAGIPAARVGKSRSERLTAAERELYFWILRRFAEEGAPAPESTAAEAARLQLDLEDVRVKLAAEDLVHFGAAGQVMVAYPFSGQPTAHCVRLNGHAVYAMCAIDALGIAAMLDQPIEINSRDPVTDVGVTVQLAPDGTATAQPEEAVVVAGRVREGAAFRGCCHVLNFFACPASAKQYLRERGEIRGHVISLPEAIEVRRCVFGDVFTTT